MTTARRPRRPQQQQQIITTAAVKAFDRMEKERRRCTCVPRDWSGDKWLDWKQCEACERWWDAHSDLHDALQAKPWDWPVIDSPSDPNPWEPGGERAREWDEYRAQPGVYDLYYALRAASKEARRQRARARATP